MTDGAIGTERASTKKKTTDFAGNKADILGVVDG
jgi:hypothetical protein